MMNKSVVDSMSTDDILGAVHALMVQGQISQFDAVEIIRYVMNRKKFTVFQLQRLQSGVDMPDVLPSALDLVIKYLELNRAIRSLKELHYDSSAR